MFFRNLTGNIDFCLCSVAEDESEGVRSLLGSRPQVGVSAAHPSDLGDLQTALQTGKDLTLISFNAPALYAYKPILCALQELVRQPFPFLNRLAFYDAPSRPHYLERARLDMRSLGDNLGVTPLQSKQFHAAVQKLPFDAEQRQAFKECFNKDLALIQGPPGTGKTYFGSRLVQVLANNRDLLKGPVLCVCYTNHALDQVSQIAFDG